MMVLLTWVGAGLGAGFGLGFGLVLGVVFRLRALARFRVRVGSEGVAHDDDHDEGAEDVAVEDLAHHLAVLDEQHVLARHAELGLELGLSLTLTPTLCLSLTLSLTLISPCASRRAGSRSGARCSGAGRSRPPARATLV